MTRLAPALLITLPLLALASASMAGRPTKRLTDEARGELLYDRHCIQCHGEHAAGDGPLTPTLVAKVPDLRPDLTEATREAHVRVVLDGRRSMPSFRNAFDRFDAERVMRHMERIAQPGYTRPEASAPTESPAPGLPPKVLEGADEADGPDASDAEQGE